MPKGNPYIVRITSCLLTVVFFSFLAEGAFAKLLPMPDLKDQFKKQKDEPAQVEMQADQVSFSQAENKAHAQGNVVVTSEDQELFCDKLDLDRAIQQVVAEGHIYLDTPQEQVLAGGMTYGFNEGTGEFRDARVWVDPYQIKGEKINKVSDNYYTMDEGYMTTCDLDEPHFRFGAHRMDIYQNDKAVARGIKLYLGKVPVMYLPHYVQDLKNRPIVTFIPGMSKDFGYFLFSTTRLRLGPHLKINVHADVRERQGFGEGFDAKYDTPNFGSGLVSTYYAAEQHVPTNHLWKLYRHGQKVDDVPHHERYRVVWRHRWQINPNTDAIWQYYKIHDYDIRSNGFLKTYFPKEFRDNAQSTNLDSYFLLTHNMPHGTLTFNVETSRVNRPIRGVERIPEVQYLMNNQQIGKTGLYIKSTSILSNLSLQDYPKTVNNKTLRFHTDNDVSRPFKVGFISFNPHLGGTETYYSRTAVNDNNVIRGMFRGSLDMTTHFYKIWDYHTNVLGMEINRLRHIITPSVTYLYQATPTYPSSKLVKYDSSIDNLSRLHHFAFGLENQLQTKRNGAVVDILRVLTTTTLGLKGKGVSEHRGLNPFSTKIDFMPTDWFIFHDATEYDWQFKHWNSHSFDGQFHGKDWSVSFGNRWARRAGDQVTGEIQYRINPKWAFRIYASFPIEKASGGGTTSAREYEYVITRDLHEWEMDLAIHQQQGEGSTIYALFRLKAMPGVKLNLVDTLFHSSRPGANQTGASQ